MTWLMPGKQLGSVANELGGPLFGNRSPLLKCGSGSPTLGRLQLGFGEIPPAWKTQFPPAVTEPGEPLDCSFTPGSTLIVSFARTAPRTRTVSFPVQVQPDGSVVHFT